ncbi:MAG: NAD-dependent deacylase [Cytophagales bacterium]|nr:NAD-dependent deacylase [Cytophagales bacterium]
MKRVVVLTGAGISAESGLKTFRDAGGFWEGYSIEEVATPQAWHKNPELVLKFYNERRKQGIHAQPNAAHMALKELEKHTEVKIITQNIDNLHEKAGSKYITHLHGEIFKSRSTVDQRLVYDIQGWELKIGDLCEKGSQLRPHIVWFGEEVPLMETAINITLSADVFLIVGTSLLVYPAASLVEYVRPSVPIYVVDPNASAMNINRKNVHLYERTATEGVPEVIQKILQL